MYRKLNVPFSDILCFFFVKFGKLRYKNHSKEEIKQEQQKKAEKKEPKISSNKVSDLNCLCQVACCAL